MRERCPDLFFLRWSERAYQHYATVSHGDHPVWRCPKAVCDTSARLIQALPTVQALQNGDFLSVRARLLALLRGEKVIAAYGHGADDVSVHEIVGPYPVQALSSTAPATLRPDTKLSELLRSTLQEVQSPQVEAMSLPAPRPRKRKSLPAQCSSSEEANTGSQELSLVGLITRSKKRGLAHSAEQHVTSSQSESDSVP